MIVSLLSNHAKLPARIILSVNASKTGNFCFIFPVVESFEALHGNAVVTTTDLTKPAVVAALTAFVTAVIMLTIVFAVQKVMSRRRILTPKDEEQDNVSTVSSFTSGY